MQSQQARVRARAAIRLRGPVCTAIGQFLNNVYARPSARPSDAPGFWFLDRRMPEQSSPLHYLPAPAAPPSNHQPRTGTTREHHARCDGAKVPAVSRPGHAFLSTPMSSPRPPHPTPAPSGCGLSDHVPPLGPFTTCLHSRSHLLLHIAAGCCWSPKLALLQDTRGAHRTAPPAALAPDLPGFRPCRGNIACGGSLVPVPG